jgi:hypothetical protein
VEQLEEEFSGGSREVKLDSEEVHNVAGALKRILLQIEPPLIPLDTLQQLQDAQFGAHPAPAPPIPERVLMFKRALEPMAGPRADLLRHMFLFMRRVAGEARHNRMDACNLARVFAASLLRHPDDLRSALYLASGRLPGVALTLLISDAIAPTTWDPATGGPLPPARVPPTLAAEEAALSADPCQPRRDGPAAAAAATAAGYCVVERPDAAAAGQSPAAAAAAGSEERPRPPGWYEGYEDLGGSGGAGGAPEAGGAQAEEGWLGLPGLGGLEPLTRWIPVPRWTGGQLAFGWP